MRGPIRAARDKWTVRRRLGLPVGVSQKPTVAQAQHAQLAKARNAIEAGRNMQRRGKQLYVKGAAVAGFGEGAIASALIATGSVMRGAGRTRELLAEESFAKTAGAIVKRRLKSESDEQRLKRRLKGGARK